ncbi:MAG: nucleotidyltransferase family protein [Oscillospiraceae bacterium]
MRIAGIIAEYNPLHWGHLRQLEQIRALLGEDTAIVCAMGGNFTQRGDFAVVRKQARAQAAICSGADLVLELPLPWATASAEGFAAGGVQLLAATGLVTDLVFGSECGDTAPLCRVAEGLLHPDFPALLKKELSHGVSFAAARQRAMTRLVGDDAELLRQPNDILGIEYCKAIARYKLSLRPLALKRTGAAHDGEETDGIASASAIRKRLLGGETASLPPAMAALYAAEEKAGRAPVSLQTCERAVLARLRLLDEADFAAVDDGGEGLYHRFYAAARTATSIGGLLETVKTKRYATARLRRMLLWVYLGISPTDRPDAPPYLRVLAANGRGRELLATLRKTAKRPVLVKPADVRKLSPEARALFAKEARATDLYTLAFPSLEAAEGGAEWKTSPVML